MTTSALSIQFVNLFNHSLYVESQNHTLSSECSPLRCYSFVPLFGSQLSVRSYIPHYIIDQFFETSAVVGFSRLGCPNVFPSNKYIQGIATDIFAYAVIIPFIPFRLEALGFKDPSSHSGWLLFAYSAGLVISTIPIAYSSPF